MNRRIILKALLVLLLGNFHVLMTSWVSAMEADEAQEAAGIGYSIQDLEARLKAVESSDSVTDKDKEIIKDFYQRSIENLKSASDNREKAKQYIQQMDSAPSKLKELQSSIDKSRDIDPPALENLSVEALERQELQLQAELLQLRNKQADLNTKTLSEEQNISNLLEEALQQQSNALKASSTQPSSETVEVANARKAFQLSEVEAANSRVEMLRQRMMTRDTRLQIIDRQQRLIARQISLTSAKVTAVDNTLNNLRQTDAKAKAKQAELREDRVSTAGPEVKAIAEENTRLASDLAQVTSRIDTLLEQLEVLRQERVRVDRYFTSMTQQLSIAGADRLASLSVDLLAQRQQFSESLPPDIDTSSIEKELTKAQMRQLRLEDRQYEYAQRPERSDNDLAQELETEQQQLLQEAVKSYRRYTAALFDILTENKGLQTKVSEYQNLLNSRLFWIPSASPIYVSFFKGLETELGGLLSFQNWKQAFSTTARGEWGGAFGSVLFLIALIILLFQSKLKKWLFNSGKNVGKVNKDKFSDTFNALIISIFLALPGPLILMACAEWVPDNSSEITFRVQMGLVNAALLWMLLGIFRQVCRKNGLADVHFQWNQRILMLAQKHLPWFMLILVVLSFFMQVANHTNDSYQTITRLLFGAVSITLSYVLHQALKPTPLVANEGEQVQPTKQRQFFRYSLYVLFTVLPIVMLVLSWIGYHFTALQLQNRLFLSACLLAALLILYSLALRGVSVMERRMKLERIKAKRKAEREQQESRQAAEEAAEVLPEIPEPEFDMAQVSRQSRGFIGLVTVLFGIYLLTGLWDNVLPALNMFDKMELWTVTSGDPNIPVQIITVHDVVLSVFLLILTYLGIRNIPGILEISVLRGVNLGPGGSYAVITVVKYLIVLIGVVSSLNAIGLPWSKLQWLVAAMGVGLGFGLQEILANFVSGLLILFERPIRVGDTVTVGENTGTVSKIRIRATTLTDWDRKEQIIPNKVFITEQLTNWTLSDPITRRVIQVGVAYGSDVLKVHKLLTEVVEKNTTIVNDPPPAVFFVGFGDSSLDFEVRVFVPGLIELMPLVHELHVAINEIFAENDIEIPFPQRDVWIREVPGSHAPGTVPPVPGGAAL